ncbi:hypothetical protein [Microbacterium invictum]|uniref:Uncharacterized protein n=1 Tax=Microbacterium invictum TaxID=515415 RepID=A0AA40VN46_9MICO|nr:MULTISPECIES: hypothetical protein [Microbacterium]MBB4140434.1 hypothetical protein [Microbacterium invictum]
MEVVGEDGVGEASEASGFDDRARVFSEVTRRRQSLDRNDEVNGRDEHEWAIERFVEFGDRPPVHALLELSEPVSVAVSAEPELLILPVRAPDVASDEPLVCDVNAWRNPHLVVPADAGAVVRYLCDDVTGRAPPAREPVLQPGETCGTRGPISVERRGPAARCEVPRLKSSRNL